MYQTDTATGATAFTLRGKTRAREVVLETFQRGNKSVRTPMLRDSEHWTAQVLLPPGFCFYRFEVDGEFKCDRVAGKCRTVDGQPCSLAIIHGCVKQGHVANS